MNKLGHPMIKCFKSLLQCQSNCGPIYCLCWRIAPFVFVNQVIKIGLLGITQGMLETLENTLVVGAEMQVTSWCEGVSTYWRVSRVRSHAGSMLIAIDVQLCR